MDIALITCISELVLDPIFVIIGMVIVLLFFGMFMSPAATVLISVPMFMPIVQHLGFSRIWFAVIVILCTEIATTSPPFGSSLFIMKGVAPPDTTMGDIIKSALPYIYCDLVVLALIIAFPMVVLWLPGLIQ